MKRSTRGSPIACALGVAFAWAALASIPFAAADTPDERAIVTESGPLKGIVTGPGNQYLGLIPPLPVLESGFATAHDCALWDSF